MTLSGYQKNVICAALNSELTTIQNSLKWTINNREDLLKSGKAYEDRTNFTIETYDEFIISYNKKISEIKKIFVKLGIDPMGNYPYDP